MTDATSGAGTAYPEHLNTPPFSVGFMLLDL